ncbi:MAG: energy-coupling factor transporter transmembrane component T family protein [Blautia sp.]|jgi:energy-coupling factor transport system permease protein
MEKLNPFAKAVSILIAALILSFSYSFLLNAGVILGCLILLLFFSRAKKTALAKIMIPAFLAALAIFFTGLLFSDPSAVSTKLPKWGILGFQTASMQAASFYNGLQLSSRVLAFACLGVLFALSTDGEEFVQSLMHQCHLSPKYAYGVLAAFHLLPVLKEELTRTRLAFKVRGIRITPFSIRPVFAMLVNTIHWSENVAMAMESKGFSSEGPRTYYHTTTLKSFDLLFGFLLNALLLAGACLLPY